MLWKRSIAVSLKTALKDTPVVSILGPRQSGKSTLACDLCPHYAYINLDEEKFLSTALSDPSGFIETLPERVIIDVVQQLIAQATWTDPDLRFWHYRDHDQVEVDLVITRGKETWGVEVKSAASTTPDDGKGLRRLADRCGEHFRGGIVFYAGDLLVRRKEKKCSQCR